MVSVSYFNIGWYWHALTIFMIHFCQVKNTCEASLCDMLCNPHARIKKYGRTEREQRGERALLKKESTRPLHTLSVTSRSAYGCSNLAL